MSASGQEEPRHQTFHGPSSFGGDNNGIINNNNVLLDPKTVAVIEDLNRKAPELAALLRKALRDGFISPDAVIAFNRAVDHLNEDTAQAFMFAAQHINEDTAISFQGVARDLTTADEQLSARVSEINDASEELRMVIAQINDVQKVNVSGYQFQLPNTAGIPSRRSVRSAANWWFISQLMCFCLGVGLLTTAILAHYHLYGDAQRIGAFAVAIPLIIWIAKAWSQARSEDGQKESLPKPSAPPR